MVMSRALQIGTDLSTHRNNMALCNDTGCKQVISDCNYILYLSVQTASSRYVIPRDTVPGCITMMYRYVIINGPVPT